MWVTAALHDEASADNLRQQLHHWAADAALGNDDDDDADADSAAAPGASGLAWQCGLCSRHAAC